MADRPTEAERRIKAALAAFRRIPPYIHGRDAYVSVRLGDLMDIRAALEDPLPEDVRILARRA